MEEGQFAELISQPVYTPLPNTPQYCLGLANVRGNIVPFYSLHVYVPGVQRPSRDQLRYALLVGDTVDGILLAIDGKPQAIERDQLVQAPRPTSMLGEPLTYFVRQTYRFDNRDWLMLDCDKLTQFLVSTEAE